MEYAFTFNFASREFPPISVSCVIYDSISWQQAAANRMLGRSSGNHNHIAFQRKRLRLDGNRALGGGTQQTDRQVELVNIKTVPVLIS